MIEVLHLRKGADVPLFLLKEVPQVKRLEREGGTTYAFNWQDRPRLLVKPDESFLVETEDAFSGVLRGSQDSSLLRTLPGRDRIPPLSNPITGPIYVEGAKKGDLLKVIVERIDLDPHGTCAFFPGAGPAELRARWPELDEPHIYSLVHEAGEPRHVLVNGEVGWCARPMIGTIGVAPDREVVASIWGQGSWGGNLDCQHVAEQSSFYVNCYHDGALLYLGDVHASQADTELCSTADETRATVTLRCQVIPSTQIPFPRVETEDALISLYSAKPLEEAVTRAISHLIEWLVEEHQFTPRQAYLHFSANPDCRIHIYQMVSFGPICYTVGAAFPRRFIEQAEAQESRSS